jgi:predicted amidophosphoribosyltransferase
MLDDGRPLLEIAWARFAPPLREGIHALKYGGSPQLAGPFGERMARAWQAGAPDWAADLVAPVPLHATRQRERGYNQSERLAAVVARVIEVRLSARRWRASAPPPNRPSSTETLGRPTWRARFAEAARVSGRRVLVIDDVLPPERRSGHAPMRSTGRGLPMWRR